MEKYFIIIVIVSVLIAFIKAWFHYLFLKTLRNDAEKTDNLIVFLLFIIFTRRYKDYPEIRGFSLIDYQGESNKLAILKKWINILLYIQYVSAIAILSYILLRSF